MGEWQMPALRSQGFLASSNKRPWQNNCKELTEKMMVIKLSSYPTPVDAAEGENCQLVIFQLAAKVRKVRVKVKVRERCPKFGFPGDVGIPAPWI